MKQSSFRIDVQALRALAVISVVIFHLWPSILPGGYIGVDVFFVISGYLITAHLVVEYSKSGRLNFISFYARRIRRLMPLAITVLIAVVIATYLFVPWRTWESTSQQLISSTFGFQNWFLAAQSVDYFAATTQPSPVQHFWSLSLEEQFYLIWPLLIFIGYKLTKRVGNFRNLQVISIIAIVIISSFCVSVIQTPKDPSIAYFSTFTHAWEFALGGLVAFVFTKHDFQAQIPLGLRNIMVSIVGFSLICYSAITFSGETQFPGFIAVIPVAGVLLVLGAAKGRDTFKNLPQFAKRPVLWTGGTSYAIYLWHWPPIVILPAILGHSLGNTSKVAILLSTFVLAFLSTRYIEAPLRFSPTRSRKPNTVFIVAALSTFSVLVLALLLNISFQQHSIQAKQEVAEAIEQTVKTNLSCYGAAAMSAGNMCPQSHEVMQNFDANFAADDWGGLPGISKDRYMIQTQLCEDFATNKEPLWKCKFGALGSLRKIAVIGDSHAFALLEPLVLLATSKGYEVEVYLHDSCSPQLVRKIDENSSSCDLWRKEVAEQLVKSHEVSTVVITGFSRRGSWVPFQGSKQEEISRYENLYSELQKSGKEIFVISDVPLTAGQKIPECVALSENTQDPCSLERSKALGWDPVITAVKKLNSPNVHLVNLVNSFCDSKKCHSVIGGLIAYRDEHHVSGSFAQSLLSELEAQIILR